MSNDFDVNRQATTAERQWLADYFARRDGKSPAARASQHEGTMTPKSSGDDRQTSIQHFHELVCECIDTRGCSRQQAIGIVAKRHPRAHQAYLAARNPHVHCGS